MLRNIDDEDNYYSDILHNVADTVLNGGYVQKNNVPEDIINELLNCEEVYCELPFSYKENDSTLWNGIIDVVYKKDGKWHIVDYKTNADPDDLDEKYKEQLNAYIKAFKITTGYDADALIYHIEV